MLEGSHLLESLSFFFLLLLFSELKLLVSNFPELSKLFILLLLSLLFHQFAMDLELSAFFNCCSHISLLFLLDLVKSICFIFGLSNLTIENLLLVISKSSQLSNLFINHALSLVLLVLESLLLTLLLHRVKAFFLFSKLSNFLVILNVFESLSLFGLQKLLVCFGKVCSHLGNSLLSGDLTLLLTLQILFSLTLDQLTFKHFLLELLDVVELEVLQLVTDVLGISQLHLVLLFELCAHLLIILGHLLLLDLFPMLFNLFVDLLLLVSHLLLGLLLVCHITHEHLSFEGHHHVLFVVHGFDSRLIGLPSQVILIGLLLGINSSPLNLDSKTKEISVSYQILNPLR